MASELIQEDLKLTGTNIVAYNMLDIRAGELSHQMLGSLNRQLISEFEKRNVDAVVREFRRSDAGTAYVVSGSGRIPLREFVTQYAQNEQDTSVKYRLLIIPSHMTISGAWRFFDVTWILEEVSSDSTVWRGVSQGEHLVSWNIDEMYEARASQIVESLFAELERSNMF
ncbi:hypothetical protein [Aliidiomarina sanyensis]|uniref:hypothetical protein n=1 Tax=Aliidiomarina sanyensis TaxID=1249555 RepID=UPI000F88FEDB|nr:hypothetical protein [Aliidiomarina sanyensis]